MKILSSSVIILLLLISCTKKGNNKTEIEFKNLNTSFINFNADSVFYKLNVGYENKDYYQDEKGNLLFLVTKEVYVGDKNFGGCNTIKNIVDVAEYSRKNAENVYETTKISIKKTDGTYDNVWKYKNAVTLNDDNSFSLFEVQISLEDSYAKYNNKIQSRLHINFKTVDYDNGYKLYTLNYIYNKTKWELVSREKVCTIPNDINHEELGYCIDTINYKCKKSGNRFDITYEDVFNLDSGVCNGKY